MINNRVGTPARTSIIPRSGQPVNDFFLPAISTAWLGPWNGSRLRNPVQERRLGAITYNTFIIWL